MHVMILLATAIPDPAVFYEADNLWWHVAVIHWGGVEFGGVDDYDRPDKLLGYEMKALEGFHIGYDIPILSLRHGFGWSAVVEYLTERYGNAIIGDVYDNIRGGMQPAAALLERMPEPEYNWWPHFVDRYLNGQIYDVEIDVLLAQVRNVDRILDKDCR